MNEAKDTTTATHTPGPWDDASKYAGVDSVRIFAGTYYIATVGNSDGPRDVTEANARLIAAAPDLLAALKDCEAVLTESAASALQVMRELTDAELGKLWIAVRTQALAAIAKAEGRVVA